MSARISPYVVFRRARLPVAELAELRFERTWARIDELAELRAESERRAEVLSDQLAELVPGADETLRGELVKLRRDIHNQRDDRALQRIEAVGSRLDSAVLERLSEWYELLKRIRHGEAEARSSLELDRKSARASFPRLFEHDAMARSVQLSGGQLYQSLLRYVSGEGASVKPSRVRTLESTLVNFAYRAALKPSPFGRFTEVGAFPPDLASTGVREAVETHSTVTLNRMLLNWLVGALQRVPGGLDLGILLLNSSLRADTSSISFIGIRSNATANESAGAEAIVRIKRDRTIDRVLAVLENGSAPVPAVVRSLTEVTGNDAVSTEILNALLRTGLLSFRPGFDEQDPAYTQRLREFLAAGTTETISALAGHLDVLGELEAKFPEASVDERQSLLRATDQAIADIAEVCAVGLPPEAIVRAPVYEDAWTRALPATWNRDSVAESLPALESLWRLSALLDYGQVKRLGLYSFAVERFGERETVPFLEFFDQFTRLPSAEQDGVLAGRGSALAESFSAQRAKAIAEIAAQIVPEDGVLRLAPEAISEACSAVADRLDPESITFRVQFTEGAPTPKIVVNGVLTGYGVYFSRFSSFIEGSGVEGWTLRSALRAHLRDVFPGQVDINAVLGFNFNLHPPLTDRVLNYPGSWPVAGDQQGYGLDSLEIRVDHARRTLRLWDPVAGEALDLMPMNFLIPVGAPGLYQLLEALTPTTRYPWQPLNDLRDALDPTAYPGSSPRLVVGEVIVDRQSWTVPAKDILPLAAVSKDSEAGLIEFDRWRRAQGLPRHAFVLCQTLAEYNTLSGRTRRLSWDWSDFAHLHKASVHKPMYVDFRNPYLVRSFAKSALSRDDVYVSVRECLPAIDEYGGDAGPAAAEEFFVEIYHD